MVQRVVSFVLLPTLLLQGACSTFAHEGTCPHGPVGHDSAPHFHLCELFGGHNHDDRDLDCSADEAFTQQGSTHCDDDDAVYVPASQVLDHARQHAHAASGGYWQCLPVAGMSGTALAAALSRCPTPPPLIFLWQSCPVYLRTLTLLI
jgi:hypothetical protein